MRWWVVSVVLSVLVLAFGSLAVASAGVPEGGVVVECDPANAGDAGHTADPRHSHDLGHHHCPQILCGAWMACSSDIQTVPGRSLEWAERERRNPTGIDVSHAEPPPRA